jgi:hypothetical protein
MMRNVRWLCQLCRGLSVAGVLALPSMDMSADKFSRARIRVDSSELSSGSLTKTFVRAPR